MERGFCPLPRLTSPLMKSAVRFLFLVPGHGHHTLGDTIEEEKPEPDEKSEIKIFRDDGCKICNPVEVITVPCYDRIDAN